MKTKLLFGLFAIGLLATACSKDDLNVNEGETGKGAVTITLNNGTSSGSRAVNEPNQETENKVIDFTVYVFNYSTGVLEKKETFAGLSGQVNGLGIASPKRVVVFVNQPKELPIFNYSDFQQAAIAIDLSTQVPGDFTSKGLFMSGEADKSVTLEADKVVQVPVTVRRLTAKIRLSSLTVTPDAGLSLDDFELTGVSIQRARDKAAPLGELRTSGFNYIGGLEPEGDNQKVSVDASYLHEYYSLPDGYPGSVKLEPGKYFYVFPNDNTNDMSTLLTLYGTYKGNPMYYPIEINNKKPEAGDNSTTDGNWIERNKIYSLVVTLKKLGTGGEDPNIPNEEVSMDVVVDVEDWEGELVQEVEW